MSENLNDKISRLERLDKRELEVFNFIIENKNIKVIDIATQMSIGGSKGIGESTVRGYLTSIFNKLEVPANDRDKRGFVVREYSEAYKYLHLNVGKRPENVSTPPVQPTNNTTPPTQPRINIKPQEMRVNQSWVIIGLMGGFLIISIIAIGILVFTLIQMNRPQLVQAATETPIQAIAMESTATIGITQLLADTPIPTDVPPTEIPPTSVPTDTPVPPPPVVVPTQQSPSIPFPFSDNFASGLSPAWKVLSGNWITSDGRLTTAFTQNEWGFVVLDDPRWTNYRVKVNYQLEKSGVGQVAVIVRYSNSRNNFLLFYISNNLSKGAFATYDGRDMNQIAGWSSVPIYETNGNIEVEANGNNFTARINGLTIQSISMSGYEQGGVGLGVTCYATCASFSNFEAVSP